MGREYEVAAKDFGEALSLLAEKVSELYKPPLDVPEMREDLDDSKKREALRKMLNSLASVHKEAALSDGDISKAADFFALLYGGEEPYRHRYADICDLVFSELGQAEDELDDGVPYSVNCLAENIRIIHMQLVERGCTDQAKSVLKLADHIDLEKTRLSHFIKQRKDMRDFKDAVSEVEAERAKLEKEFDERLDKTRMEYIAILGVFAAVVLAFNGGVGFSVSLLNSIGIAGGVRTLVLLTALVGFVLVNAICILLVFVWKMSFNHRDVKLGKWPRNCLITADAFLIGIMLVMMALGHPAVRAFVGL